MDNYVIIAMSCDMMLIIEYLGFITRHLGLPKLREQFEMFAGRVTCNS